MNCLQQKQCVGFSYLIDAKEHEINCQTSKMTINTSERKLSLKGKWTFYQIPKTTYGLLGEDKKATDCAEVQKNGKNESGVYQIDPDGQGCFNVYCDMASRDGGWTVFQRRLDGSVDFYRGWKDYKEGFGNLSSEFWLGLDKINRLTSAKRNKLRIEMGDTSGNKRYAEYDYFMVKNESSLFELNLGTYSGNAKNSLTPKHNYMKFTTKDADHDSCEGNCAIKYKGAWWYNCCYDSNLNGYYYHGFHEGYKGVVWRSWKGMKYSLKSTEMKIKP
ncbi:angiopoietin-related protein 7-like isoform X2 [Xenia sp. Carnegie-2017]|nr:angiopoietin-related protein 7-like isoform X2 [Xenia sp. Carnegie-2017]